MTHPYDPASWTQEMRDDCVYPRSLPLAEILYEPPPVTRAMEFWWAFDRNWPLIRLAIFLGISALVYAVL